MLERAELYATDELGHRIPAADRDAIGRTVMPVRPTRTHALSHPESCAEESLIIAEQIAASEREMRAELALLSTRDREILRLHLMSGSRRLSVMTVSAHQASIMATRGWTVSESLPDGRARMTRATVGKLSAPDIAKVLGVSSRTVERALSRMSPALLAWAELIGETLL